MIILYGSQGGTSKEAAKLLQNIIRFGYSKEYICGIQEVDTTVSVMEMNDFEFSRILDIDCIVFVCSTHGNGTEPFNMTRFWNTLKKITHPNFLSHLRFAVFGLGDSSYDFYNYCSKKLYNLLIRLGATPLVRRGCGDSQDKEGWLTDFREWVNQPILKTLVLEDVAPYRSNIDTLFDVEIKNIKLITPKTYENQMIELEMSINGYKTFTPGDCLGVLPRNYNIKEFMVFNNVFSSEIEDLDFNGIPQIIFFSYLYQFILKSDLKIEEEKLRKIGELFQDYSFYYDYILKPKRTIFETLKELDIRLSLEFMIRYIPKISVRYFTLIKRSDSYFVILSIVRYKTILKQERKGLCSEYLKDGLEHLKCRIGKSMIVIKKEKILIICTGAGISMAKALVGFYREKEIVVYYGFRYRDKDCVSVDTTANVKVYYAASRDDKKYVQDVFRENPIENIQDYDIVVSGNSRLNKIVGEMFAEIYGQKISFYCETW
ncbi:NADPH-dependent diflavin oxidoreductase 1 [Nosema granulosis]|uniref:NADPH-dependent diflavin oxidoreductase 1 n=1 Tax=Nosema granulosis TaxID=83296 RepID=A0A9P6GZR0_9MICR|nr:NADPH-dependent diflavin oxidoreductase 1 [Nosema granulosis]